MSWRKWYVRGLVLAICVACGCALLLYQRWTNPGAVRALVLAKIGALFPGAVATVDSARLRILGDIAVNELRLARRDDPDQAELIHVPRVYLHHNKEKILDGELSLRKVELHRPRLTLQRNRAGQWNLLGIGGPANLNQPLPTLVIHQGTLVLDDRGSGDSGKILELGDVHLTLINDPLSTVLIDGSASSATLGKVQVHGQWQRGSQEITLSIKAAQVPLTGLVVDKLATLCPAGSLQGLHLEGRADVKAEVAYRPGSADPLSYDVQVQVSGGKVRHPKLPLALVEVEASLQCANGELRLEKFQARSGKTEIEAEGFALLPCIDQAFEGHLEIKHLELSPELFAHLPDKLRSLQPLYKPSGMTTLRVACARRGTAWQPLAAGAPSRVVLLPENLGVCFERFPYPVERMTGTFDLNLITKVIQVDLTAFAGSCPVVVKGTCAGEGTQVDADFDIIANDLPLDEKMVAALPANFQKLAQSFHAAGKGDVKAHVRHVPGDKEYQSEYHVRFHDCAVQWDQFPYPLDNVSGFLDIYPRHWEFRDFRGSHRGGAVVVQGYSVSKEVKEDAGNGLILEIAGTNIALDEDLHLALKPLANLYRSWNTFQPKGRMRFTAKIDHRTNAPEDVELRLNVSGCTIEPAFFPYPLDELAGQFQYRKNRLDLSQISASHAGARLTLEKGTVDLNGEGGYFADLGELRVKGLIMDAALLKALPISMRGAAAALNLKEPVDLKTSLVVAQGGEPGSQPDVYWDGQLWLKDAALTTGVEWTKVNGTLALVGRVYGRQLRGVKGNLLLDEATLFGQPFRNLQAQFHVKENAPDVLLLGLRGPIHGGDISGQVRVEFNSSLRYDLNLTASQIDLGEFGRHNLGPTAQLQGIAVGRLSLSGQGAAIDTLDGNGSLDVPNGRLYNLPLLLDLLKFLGLRWPDRTAFEELHALFSIRGNRVALRKLELLGNAVSLSGKGEFNLDGTGLAIDFYPTWARVDQLLPPSIRPIAPTLTKNILTIEMRGKVGPNPGDLKFTKKPLPGIVDPFMQMRGIMTGSPAVERK